MTGLGDAETSSPLSTPPESIADVHDHEMRAEGKTPRLVQDNSPLPAVQTTGMESDSIIVANSNDKLTTTSPKPAVPNSTKKRKAPTPVKLATTSKKAKNEAKKWQSPFIYTDPKTPLAQSDLRAILLNSRAWDVLSDEEQREVLGLLPEHTHTLTPGTKKPRPDVESLRNNDTFRFDSARYCESIAAGKHDPGWLECAWTAHERRNRGDFDNYQVQDFEKSWSTRIAQEHRPEALRSERRASHGGRPRNSAHPANPEMASSKYFEHPESPGSTDPTFDSPKPASSHSSSSVEKKIARVDIAKEEPNGRPNGCSLPVPPQETQKVAAAAEEMVDDVAMETSDQT